MWLNLFRAGFKVEVSPRMGSYGTKGQVSKNFHEACAEAVLWAKRWRARQEAEQWPGQSWVRRWGAYPNPAPWRQPALRGRTER